MKDNLKKAIFRFRQFGGWRMLRAYTKAGVLSQLLKEVARVVIQGRPLKEAYPAVSRRIVPILETQYRPLAKKLLQHYDDNGAEHQGCDVVWFCWLQGMEQAPVLVKACLASLKRHIKDKRFVCLSLKNYQEYVKLDPHIEELYRKGILPHAIFTDFLRLELLIKYGGTWIDSTVYCTGDDYPNQMMDCDLFFFQYLKKGYNGYVGISNWFISAYSNNRLLTVLRDMLLQYWKDYDCLIEYYIFHVFFRLIAEQCPEDVASMPKISSNQAILMAQLLEKAYDEKIMTMLKSRSNFHKLDYRKSRCMTDDGNPTFYSHIINNM